MGRAQVSIEAVILVGFAFISTLALTAFFVSWYATYDETINIKQAQQTARLVADKITEVSLLGEDTKTTFDIYLPEDVESFNISNREVFIRLRTSSGPVDIVEVIDASVLTNLSIGSSKYTLVAEARDNFTCVYIRGEHCSVCVDGSKKKCDTGKKGICAEGWRTCSGGDWEDDCPEIISPGDYAETCGNYLDDDCDGVVDNGC